jgi:hypothetical protein
MHYTFQSLKESPCCAAIDRPGYKDDSTTLPSSMALVAHNQIQDGPLDPKEKGVVVFFESRIKGWQIFP